MTLIVPSVSDDAWKLDLPVMENVDSPGVVADSIQRATLCWTGKIGKDVVAIWGIQADSLLSRSGYIWLSTSAKIEKYQFIFIKESKLFVEHAGKDFDYLYGIVDDRFLKSKRWLQWLGFTLSAPIVFNDVPICRFDKRYR